MSSDRNPNPRNRTGSRDEIGSRSKPWKHVLMTLGAVVVLGAFVAAGVIFSGLFNVAATVVDSPPLNWMLVTVREGSIKRHARSIQAPPLDDAARLDRGFRLYREDCVMCHTPVGRTPTQMAVGFNPQAPGFGEGSDAMTAAELFWVTKNGIRFTGMPAWGPSHSDPELWDVVAFVLALPKMSAADYAVMDLRLPPGPAMQSRPPAVASPTR